jgi:predicted O-methyltransferase YrrM
VSAIGIAGESGWLYNLPPTKNSQGFWPSRGHALGFVATTLESQLRLWGSATCRKNFSPPVFRHRTNFSSSWNGVNKLVEHVDGWLTPREIEFLALLGAYPKAAGSILEIGSFRGRSTIVLAKAAELSDQATVHAVDPLDLDEWMEQTAAKKQSSPRAILEKNLASCGVSEKIQVHQAYSHKLAPTWNQPLRVLWIDGDHTYQGALADYENYLPHLAVGGIIAFHDVMTAFECGRVFLDKVVKSPRFNKVGICGSIGWGQFSDQAVATAEEAEAKARFAKQLARVESYDKTKIQTNKIYRMGFKMNRWFVQHGPMEHQQWRQVA